LKFLLKNALLCVAMVCAFYSFSQTFGDRSNGDIPSNSDKTSYMELPADLTSKEPRSGAALKTPSSFDVYGLDRNRPDPAITVRFETGEKGFVDLAVFDTEGNKVKTLIARELDSGPHSVVWEGRNDSGLPLTSGVYLCRIDANGSTETRKIQLLND
jgi:hypothetical protein